VRENASNLLLEGLKASSRGALMADSEKVVLRAGEPLQEGRRPMSHAYFPVRGSVSLSVGGGLDLGLVGFEGMVGLGLALDSPVMELSTRVHSDGLAWRVSAPRFVEHLSEQPSLRARMNRYALVQILQLAQDATCRSHHTIEQRLARQLLKARDRARSDELSLTHEALALILAVRRACVSLTASAWRRQALVRYARGHIHLIDIEGLRATACSCYAMDKRIYARLLTAGRLPE
jgi:CRP-like cAMP-binding protein